jgi:hypothetical protein
MDDRLTTPTACPTYASVAKRVPRRGMREARSGLLPSRCGPGYSARGATASWSARRLVSRDLLLLRERPHPRRRIFRPVRPLADVISKPPFVVSERHVLRVRFLADGRPHHRPPSTTAYVRAKLRHAGGKRPLARTTGRPGSAAHVTQLVSTVSRSFATRYRAGFSLAPIARKCAFPHSILPPSAARRSSVNRPPFVSTTK